MRIHHLNCISPCPLGGVLMDGQWRASAFAKLVCHALLIEAPDGLVLVDTGYGLRDCAEPHTRLSKFFLGLMTPDLREEMTAIRQIARMGFDPQDVRHIVLSHLDFDHAGGLDDFPWATVHMMRQERMSAEAQKTWLDRQRYRPQQWNHRGTWTVHDAADGERWLGFDLVRPIAGLDDVLMIPLVGHTMGHAGVAVRRERDWLLYAGDAYFHHGEMQPTYFCPPGLWLYQRMMQKDGRLRLENQRRLRALAREHGDAVTPVSAHDRTEFERLARPAEELPSVQPGAAPLIGG